MLRKPSFKTLGAFSTPILCKSDPSQIIPANVLLMAISSISNRILGSVHTQTTPDAVPMKRYWWSVANVRDVIAPGSRCFACGEARTGQQRAMRHVTTARGAAERVKSRRQGSERRYPKSTDVTLGEDTWKFLVMRRRRSWML